MANTMNNTAKPLCRHCVHVRTRLTRGAYTQRVCGKAGKAHLLIEECPFFQRAVGADDDQGVCHVG